MSYYAILHSGSPTTGKVDLYYRSLDNARSDARSLSGGSLQTVRIVECDSRVEAIGADISGRGRVVETVR